MIAKTRSCGTARQDFVRFVEARSFPCIGAKSALNKDQVTYFEGGEITSSRDDGRLLRAFYEFVSSYRRSRQLYTTFVVFFDGPLTLSEKSFEAALWARLAALHVLDRERYGWASAVSSDPQSALFSFSLGEEAFFVVGLHPAASRKARRFTRPTLVFNLHDQFERLRDEGRFDSLRNTILKRDAALDGVSNPMLASHGETSEARQYSGRRVDESWKCPFSAKSRNPA